MNAILEVLSEEVRLGEILYIIVLLFTLRYIIKYTKATVDLKNLEISPFIYFFTEGDKFYIKNIGRCLALNIEITPLRIKIVDRNSYHELIFDRVNYLEPSKVEQLTYRNFLNGTATEGDIFPFIHPEYQKEHDIGFKIAYRDVMGLRYETRFTIGKSGVVINSIRGTSKWSPAYLFSRFSYGVDTWKWRRKVKKVKKAER